VATGTVGNMPEPAAGVSCVYCGGRHSRVDEVRACWERSERAARTPAPGRAPPAAGPEPTPSSAGGPVLGRSVPVLGRSVPVLGRSVVVSPGQLPPGPWKSCQRASGRTEELEQAWRERVPLVVEVDDEPVDDEVEQAPVWSLSPSFSFPGERRAHAIFANAVDARPGLTPWRLTEEAVRLGATAGGPADVVLPNGQPAYCDGGPLEWHGAVLQAGIVHRVALLAGSLVSFGPNQTDAPLAPDQLAAVLHPGGAARIIAPAGSGKTRVLTERARHLLRHWRLPGRGVTLVAFNKRAADEMRERTPDLPDLQVRTLNALGLYLVSRSDAATTIDERDVRTLLGTLVDLPHRANTDPAVAWIEALSAVRLGLEDPAAVEADFGGDVDGLPEVFVRYRRLLASRQLVDFDEQVYRAIEILLTAPAARRSARDACRVLLVDEFQDLTPAHVLLIRLLSGPEGAVFGVGDDDQTIYGYSGASPEWLIDFGRFFPTAGRHALEVNYRCPVTVVEAARNLLTHNRQRLEKRIVAAPGRAPSQGELAVVTGEDPLTGTVGTVTALISDGAAPRDVAVLTRVNASLAPVQVALVHRDIPIRPAVDPSYLSRGGVQAALAWLRLAVSPPERLAQADVVQAARRPSRALSPKAIEWMSEQSSLAGLERLAGRLKGRDSEKVFGFVEDLQAVRRHANSGRPGSNVPRSNAAGSILRAVRDDIGLGRAMELLEGSRRHLDRSAQTDDLDALVALAALHPEPEGFDEWLLESLRKPGSADGVVLSTVHRVKGREWPHVVLHDVSAGLLPHRLAVDVEEERRVFHVGLTRASSSVHVVAGEEPSPFLIELVEPWNAACRPPTERRAQTSPPVARPRPDPARPDRARPDRASQSGAVKTRPPIRQEALKQETLAPEAAARVRAALRAWRSERATAEHKPAFIFLHDRTLEALAASAPTSMTALSRVNGIGPAKLGSYGDELLALITSAVEGA
jgi:DNA helicase II / ATP-dependent DNA helicase PcrA